MLANFTWRKPEDASEQKICADVAQHGCHIVTIPEDLEGPTYSFSIGLYLNFQHPEIVIFGLNQEVAATTINDIFVKVENGRQFQVGESSDEFFNKAKLAFVEFPPSAYHEFLGCARWFYRSLDYKFPVLQGVWTDKLGKFPWENGHDQKAAKLQPILKHADR